MNLLQRVTTLIRANINDLIDRAEDPEKMIKQLILDLNNQLIQVKTTVAQQLADQHLMEKKLQQAKDEVAAYARRAQVAVERGDDNLARAALTKQNSFQRTADETDKQLQEQKQEVESLKLALSQLETKIGEVTRHRDMILARQRRATAKEKINKARTDIHPEKMEELLNAIGGYVDRAEAKAQAADEMRQEHEKRQLDKLDEDTKIDQQLAELKARRAEGGSPA